MKILTRNRCAILDTIQRHFGERKEKTTRQELIHLFGSEEQLKKIKDSLYTVGIYHGKQENEFKLKTYYPSWLWEDYRKPSEFRKGLEKGIMYPPWDIFDISMQTHRDKMGKLKKKTTEY